MSAVDCVLGNPGYRVFLQGRGGTGGKQELETESGAATRALDNISYAQVAVPANSECCGYLENAEPLAHEIAVWADTEPGGDPLWVGPITQVDDDGDKVTIIAGDLATWFELRVLHEDHDWKDVDVGIAFMDVVNDALFGGPVEDNPGIVFDLEPVGVPYTAAMPLSVRRYAITAIDSLAERGLDWTMIGRTLVTRPHTATPQAATLTHRHFLKRPKTRRTSETYANAWYVVGNGGAAGAALNPSEFGYGLVERIETDALITTNAEADSFAASLVAGSSIGAFIDPSGVTTLAPNAPLSLDQLQPGLVYGLALPGCPGVSEYLRMSDVRFKWTVGGSQIQVGFEPVSSIELALVGESTVVT